jgi:hypothetical protein
MKTILYKFFIGMLILLCFITLIILYKFYTNKTKEKLNELNPTPFKTGYLNNSPQKVADVCNSTMYPVHIDYSIINSGNPTQSNCFNNIFNSPP